MCYYNGQKVTRAEYIRLKQLEKEIAKYDFLKNDLHSGFDYGMNAALKPRANEEDFDIVQMEWGFIPTYMKTRDQVHKMRHGYYDNDHKYVPPSLTLLNAKAEELLKPGKMWEDAARHRRCLILSSGFFEWQHIYPKNKRTGQPRKTAETYPYHITVKDQEYFYMAGIWQPWVDQVTGEYVECSAIVTTTAVGHQMMSQIHNTKLRMPTILTEDLGYEWIFGDLSDERLTEIAMTQFPSDKMQACTVEKGFRSALEPTKAHRYEDLPALELSL